MKTARAERAQWQEEILSITIIIIIQLSYLLSNKS